MYSNQRNTMSNPIVHHDSDTETQSPSPSPSSSFSGGGNEINEGETVPWAGETQVLDFDDDDEDTQVLEYVEEYHIVDDDQNVTTPLVDDAECSDKTQVLSDEDGICVDKDYVVDDSDVETITDYKPSALLRNSGQSSYQMIPPAATKSSFPSNSPCGERHLDKDDGIDGLKDLISPGIEVKNADLHNNMQHDMLKMEGHADKTELGDASLTEDKIINEDTSVVIGEHVKNSGCYEGPKEMIESPAYDYQFAGLSYVGSQEPGEFSQANALNVVDKYLAVNHVEISQEDECAITLNGLSPLISRPKGTQILAKSSGKKSLVRDVAIYDWVDSSQDGGGGDNSTNSRSGCHDQRSLLQPRKPRYVSKQEGMSANISGEDSLNLHQKRRCLTCSDTGVFFSPEQNSNMVQPSEVSTVKKLSSTLDEKLNTDSLEKPLEGSGCVDLPELYDTGFDTQMAAEAMGALCQADPPDQDTVNFCQVSEKVSCGSPRVVTKSEAHVKRVYVRKRVSSDFGAGANRSQRRRKLVKKVDYVDCDLLQPRKPRYVNKQEGMSANISGEDTLNLHQKRRRLTCSDTRVLSCSKQNSNMLQPSEVSTVKKLSSNLDEKLNTDSLEKSFEGSGRVDLPDFYNIGFDTQVAAEAMETLCQTDPPYQFCQVSEKVSCGSPRVVTTSEAHDKRVYVRKRVSSDSGVGNNRSQRRRKLVKKVDYVNSDLLEKDFKEIQTKESVPVSLVTRKSKIVKSKAEERQTNGISFDGGAGRCRGPSNLVQSRKTMGALESLHRKNLKRCDALKTPINNFEVTGSRLQEDFRTFTPIACRTRRSKAASPLTGSILLNCYDAANGKVGTNLSMDKSRGHPSSVDASASAKKSKLDSSQIAKARSNELIQLEPPVIGIMLEETTKKKTTDFHSYSKAKRKCQNILKASNLEGASIVASGRDIHGQCILRRKRSKVGGRDSSRAKPLTVWGSKFETNFCVLSDGNRTDMSKVTAEDKNKSSNRSTICNQTNHMEAPSPICMELESTSRKAAAVPPIEESRKISLADIRLLLSHHLDDNIIKQQQRISSRLGLAIVSSSFEATHFIADKFVRTRNMLEAIAFGKPVVTHLWLESCKKANSFVDETNYILRDFEKEKEFGFSMPESLACARACNSQLLQGKKIFVTPNVKPSRELVASLATTVHGQVVKRIGRSEMDGDNFSEDLLVLSCDEDYAACVPFLSKRAVVYSSELILSGIIIQKLEYERHRLFGDGETRRDCVKRKLHC